MGLWTILIAVATKIPVSLHKTNKQTNIITTLLWSHLIRHPLHHAAVKATSNYRLCQNLCYVQIGSTLRSSVLYIHICQWNDEPSHHLGDMLHLSLTSHSITINIIEPGHWTSVLLKSSTFAPLSPCIPAPVYCLHPLCPVLLLHLEPSTFFVQEQQEKISWKTCWNFDGLKSWLVAKKGLKRFQGFQK